jgi:hypothetical protein
MGGEASSFAKTENKKEKSIESIRKIISLNIHMREHGSIMPITEIYKKEHNYSTL